MTALLLSLTLSAFAGPGFSGVGGPEKVPGFGDDATEDARDIRVADVLRREAELLAAVEQYDEEMYGRMLVLKATDRRSYVAALVKVARNVQRARRDPAFRERMQAMSTLQRQLRELAEGYPSLPDRKKPAARAELERLAGKLMDLKQADRRQRLQDMEARLAEVRSEIERREAERDQIIEEFVNRLLTGPVDL